jgi:hypothetical protein
MSLNLDWKGESITYLGKCIGKIANITSKEITSKEVFLKCLTIKIVGAYKEFQFASQIKFENKC